MKQFSRISLLFACCMMCFTFYAHAQDALSLIQKVKAKLDLVNDYTAQGKMKTDVAFIKAPVGKVNVYYKKPNKFKIKRESGISILPKGGVTVNVGSVLAENDFTVIDAGETTIDTVKTRIIKLLPSSESSDVVITTLYIDEKNLLVMKAITTTKENGTFEMQMKYGSYAKYGLPDKLIFSFNTKDYKMPKGVTMEFDDVEKADKDKMKNKKGKVEITYSSYIINKGVDDSVFKQN